MGSPKRKYENRVVIGAVAAFLFVGCVLSINERAAEKATSSTAPI